VPKLFDGFSACAKTAQAGYYDVSHIHKNSGRYRPCGGPHEMNAGISAGKPEWID
jgi:hypothetical protein